MVKTQVADIIVPAIFEKYAIERTAELSNFAQRGIVQNDVVLQLTAGHRIIKITFAEGGPIEAVGLVQQHLMILRSAGGALGGAVQ